MRVTDDANPGKPWTTTGSMRLSKAYRSAIGVLQKLVAEAGTPIAIYVTTRAALFLITYLSLALLPEMAQDQWRGFPGNLFLDGWTRWDAGWFRSIVERGYSAAIMGPSGQRNVAFFPLYPLLMSVVRFFLHNSLMSGIVVSNLAFLLAAIILFQLVRQRFDADVATRTLLLWAVFPFSFYFTTVYSDALFCLLAVAAFFLGERQRWWLAGICGLLAGTTRLAGIVLLPTLAILYLEKIHFDLHKVRLNVLWLTLAGLGPVVYFVYLYVRFGDLLLYLQAMYAEPWWPDGRGIDLVFTISRQLLTPQTLLTGRYPVAFAFNLGVTVLLFLTLVFVFRYQGLAAGVFSLALIALSLNQWVGMGRYALAMFPAFIAWAQVLRNRLAFEGVLVASSLLLALWAIVFAHWVWVT